MEGPATTTSASADATSAEPAFVVHGAMVFDSEHFRQGDVQVVGSHIAGFVDAPPPSATVIDGRGQSPRAIRKAGSLVPAFTPP